MNGTNRNGRTNHGEHIRHGDHISHSSHSSDATSPTSPTGPIGPTNPTGSTPRVLVVGSGPTGLLLAGDLATAGVPVTVLEKRPRRISNLSRAFVLHARTLEQIDARGLADELEALGQPLSHLNLFGRLTMDLGALPSRFNHLLVLPQYEVERALERRAAEAGAEFRYETEVTGLAQDAGSVTLRVRGPEGRTESLRGAYAVGADGMRSTVRNAIGLPFPGRSVIRSVVLADVRLTEQPADLLTVNATGDAFAFLAPFGDGYHRLIGWQRGRDAADHEPLDLAEVKEITRLALGRDFGMHDPRWMSRFHSDERQAPAYRAGRVFLAGDAAHVHTPAGGQGMNTGLQDAANLSWKLAAVVTGHADPVLLDSYQAERHPVGRAVLRSSGGIVRLAMAHRPWTRAARAALTGFLGAVGPARRAVAAQVTGIGYRYTAPKGAHRLTGTRVPDVTLAGGGRLHEALRGGRFVLITARPQPHAAPTPAPLRAPAPAPYGSASGSDGGRADRLAVAHWASGRRTAVLVRPDGYVAWAADSAGPAALEAALARHLGPRHRTHADRAASGVGR